LPYCQETLILLSVTLILTFLFSLAPGMCITNGKINGAVRGKTPGEGTIALALRTWVV